MPSERLFVAREVIPSAAGSRWGSPAALAVSAGRITRLAQGDEVTRLRAAPYADVIDLGAATVLPGLWDAHVHFIAMGLALSRLDLGAARSLDDAFDLIRGAAGDELLVTVNLDETLLAEKRLPTGKELDKVAASRPVVVTRVDGHSSVVNAAAWRVLNIQPDWPGVELDVAGQPTGRLRGRANELAHQALNTVLSAEKKRRACRAAADYAISRGVVAVGAFAGSPYEGAGDVRILGEIRNELPLEVFLFPQITSVAEARALGFGRLGGCILLDGSLGSWTAALTDPYADRPETRGELYFGDDDLNALVLAADAAGLQLAFHAIGDRAITQLLNAYELAHYERPRPSRHRVEHAELITPRDIKRAAALGVVLSVQPAFEKFWGGPGKLYAQRLGPQRARTTNPFKSALRAGVVLAGGSDAPITPIDPIAGILAAMEHPNPAERLTFNEALALFTAGAAYSFFAEADWGTLSPGKWASFTVVDRVPNAGAAAPEVLATVVKGEVVFRK